MRRVKRSGEYFRKSIVVITVVAGAVLLTPAGYGQSEASTLGTAGLAYEPVKGGYEVSAGKVKSGAVVIPGKWNGKAVVAIAARGFDRSYGITKLTIPSGVATIGEEAFAGCRFLRRVNIPSSVISIGAEAFSGCTALERIAVAPSNPEYSSVDGVLFNKNRTKLVEAPGAISGSYVVPSSVTSIGDGAFFDCGALTRIVLPKNITAIGNDAFFGCSGLTAIALPTGLKSIGKSAFAGCAGLTEVTIPVNVVSIGDHAFSYCPALRVATFAPPNPPNSSGGLGWQDHGLIMIKVPPRSGWKYLQASDWGNIRTLIFYPTTGTINESDINFRKGPDLGAKIIGTLNSGERVRVIGRSNHEESIGPDWDYWYMVRRVDGTEGWLYGAFVNLSE